MIVRRVIGAVCLVTGFCLLVGPPIWGLVVDAYEFLRALPRWQSGMIFFAIGLYCRLTGEPKPKQEITK